MSNSAQYPDLDRYFPHYQPLIYLPSGSVAGYELLARTRNDAGAVVSAGALFNDSRLPVDFKIAVDRHVRRLGLEYFANNADSSFVTLNISPDWINRLGDNVSSPTLRMIEATGIDPSRVVIEITETAGDSTRLQRWVKQYHAVGLRVAIDDFGAGNSQLDRIIALEPDIVKLDMRLFKNAARGGLPADVLLGMIAVTERAGFEVVCEGVETLDEFCFGIDCGAQYMQGFLFSTALPAAVDPQTFSKQQAELVDVYCARKTALVGRSIDHSRAVKAAVLALRQQLLTGTEPHSVKSAALRELGIMRFFICDARGLQLSPNFEVVADGICIEEMYVGYNWSWRPYFPTLMAMHDRVDFEIVASAIYRDASTSVLCKTFGTFLDSQRVLLVDAAVHDEVLFAGD